MSCRNRLLSVRLRKGTKRQRRGGDSNPRWSFPHTAFPVLHNRPLCHLSKTLFLLGFPAIRALARNAVDTFVDTLALDRSVEPQKLTPRVQTEGASDTTSLLLKVLPWPILTKPESPANRRHRPSLARIFRCSHIRPAAGPRSTARRNSALRPLGPHETRRARPRRRPGRFGRASFKHDELSRTDLSLGSRCDIPDSFRAGVRSFLPRDNRMNGRNSGLHRDFFQFPKRARRR
jgi:hypothetical protein